MKLYKNELVFAFVNSKNELPKVGTHGTIYKVKDDDRILAWDDDRGRYVIIVAEEEDE